MENLAQRIGLSSVRLSGGVLITFLFFVFVSLLHSLFGTEKKEKAAVVQKRRIIAEMIKPPPPRPSAPPAQRLRQVATQSAQGKGGESRMMSKFTPDLDLDVSAAGGEGAVVAQTSESGAEVFEDGKTDEPAQPQFTPQIPYPDKARELGVEGTLEAVFVVMHTGKTSDIQIVRSPHATIAAAARRAIAEWRFVPAKNKGVPVSCRKRQVVDFALDH